MDNFRVLLWVGLGLLLWLNVTMWQQQFATPRASAGEEVTASGAPTVGGDAGGTVETGDAAPRLPSVPDSEPVAAAGTAAGPTAGEPTIRVRTDVLDAEISLRGGDLRSVLLPDYPVHKNRPEEPVQLLSPEPAKRFQLNTGLRAAGGRPEPVHSSTLYTADASEYRLADDSDELRVPLRWQSPDGSIAVERTLVFRRGAYTVDLVQRVQNLGAEPYQAASYVQIERVHLPPERSMFDVDSYSFTGPVAYNGDSYRKLEVEDLADKPFRQEVAKGWMAAIQHHFLVAAVPPPEDTFVYEASARGNQFTISFIGPLKAIAPEQSAEFTTRLFVGPKLQDQLAATAEDLDLTVDYGRLTLLAQPLFWLLDKVHDFVGNWGWSIIIVTILIKLAFYKLSETSGRSMARMRKLQPRMQALQERYKDDRAALSQHLMELYKREKINPAAGCLPMLVQIPFFIAFYWVLLESVEMRQAPFALWIDDLSSRDPFFILPLLMGAAMWFQQKLNPAPPDPVQAKVMQIMPVMFTVFFAFFPAGLVLYWLTNSVLSIAQQWRINKVLKAD